MTAMLIDGGALASRLLDEIRDDVEEFGRRGPVPRLAGVLVGDNPGAENFARNQRRACEKTGVEYREVRLERETTLGGLRGSIRELVRDPRVSGIVLHRPLPSSLEGDHVPTLLPAEKDVEGMHPENIGRLIYRSGGLPPCTAMAAVELLRSTETPLEGKEAVVVGHSEIVGKPIALWLLNRLATVTVCHHATRDLARHTRRAEILFVAVGKPGLIRPDMVRPDSVVIDIGINRIRVPKEGGGTRRVTVGDVDPEVADVAAYLTPVPGGVGPVTVAMLLRNTVDAARRQQDA